MLSQKNVRPGGFLNYSIVSDPNSLCAWSAIDKSVSFMGKRNTLDIQKVRRMIKLKKIGFYEYILRLLMLYQNLNPPNGPQIPIQQHLIAQVCLFQFDHVVLH